MNKTKADYTLLAIICAGYLAFIFAYQAIPSYIMYATGTFATIYIIWGVFHHLRSKSFHGRVVLEYFLVATLGVAIVSTLLL